jgi:hypothetical protein
MLTRTALAALLATVLAAIFAAAAPAAIVPTLTLDQIAGTTAGSSPATGFDINLHPFGADSAKDISISLPAGAMLNLQVDGGICLTSATPLPACRIGVGTANGVGGTPVGLYLVAPLKSTDIAGIALTQEGGTTTTGDLTFVTAPTVGETISLRLLPPGIAELNFALENLRLPSSCGAEQEVAVAVASWAGFQGSTTSTLHVTGCSSLPYAPTLSATATKQKGEETVIAVTFTQRAGESSTSSLKFGIPSGMKLNRVLLPCFQGTVCSIGSVLASSPLLPPAALGSGTLTLTGSLTGTSLYTPISGVALTLGFPAPYPFHIVGPVSLSERVISYNTLPDIPLSTLTFDFTGTTSGSAFTTPCRRSTIAATLTPQAGTPPAQLAAPVTMVGCSNRPVAAGSLTGLAKGAPKLRLRANAASDPADISSLAITLPRGLRFKAGACAAGGGCKIKGLRLSGARVARAVASGASLRLTLVHPAATVVVDAAGPLVHQTTSARHRASGATRLLITDTQGKATTVKLR